MRATPGFLTAVAWIVLMGTTSSAFATHNVHIQNCIADEPMNEFVAAEDVGGVVGTQGTKVEIPYEGEADLKCPDNVASGACFVKVHGHEWNLVEQPEATFYGVGSVKGGVLDTDCTQSP